MFLEFGAPRHRNTELGVQKFTMLFGHYGCQHVSRFIKKIMEIKLCNKKKLSHVVINNRPSIGRLQATVCR